MAEMQGFQENGQTGQGRQVAYKVSIKDLLEGQYFVQEGWNPNYILTKNRRKISRANIIANVTDKREGENFCSLTIDDSTGNINATVFAENVHILKDKNPGDLILIVGRPRVNNNQTVLIVEIARKLEPEWAKLRKLELEAISKEVKPVEEEVKINQAPKSFEEEIIQDMNVQEVSERQKMVNIINNLDKGEGAPTEIVVKHFGNNADALIQELLKEGEIFEIKPGRLKVL